VLIFRETYHSLDMSGTHKINSNFVSFNSDETASVT